MSTIQNTQPQSRPESKSAKKKKAKAEAPAQPSAATPEPDAAAGHTATDGTTNGADGAYESPYLKELYKYVTHRATVVTSQWLTRFFPQKHSQHQEEIGK